MRALCGILVMVSAMGFQSLPLKSTRISSKRVLNNRIQIKQVDPASSSSSSTSMSMIELASAFDTSSLINNGFNIATFGPQPFWLLMCILPNFSLTRKLMMPWTTVVFFALVHLMIVIASISQPDGTAPITEVII